MVNILTSIKRFVLGLKRPSKKANLRRLNTRHETISDFLIRDAKAEDVSALAELHVRTWRETYWTTGSSPGFQTREYQWQQQFMIADGSWFCFVVVNKAGNLVGFAMGKKYNHSDLPGFSGELNKIYLLRQYQRLGLGRKLMSLVARRFLSIGISNMVLFGLAENPSCAFYEALGGERLYAKNGDFHGGYCWKDLNRLVDSSSDNTRQH